MRTVLIYTTNTKQTLNIHETTAMHCPELILNKQADRRLKKGHLWVYSNEINTKLTPLKNLHVGELVDIVSASGQFLGRAIVNPNALICGRVISKSRSAILDTHFFAERLLSAQRLRELYFSQPYYRLIYGDSDFLPGVVVDRYGQYFVVQTTTAGMESAIEPLIQALQSTYQPSGIIIKNNHSGRELEGLDALVDCRGHKPERLSVIENNTTFEFDVFGGQKTGWFYDHRINRQWLQTLARGKRILDVFSYIGGWGIQAATAGADSVLCVDASQSAIDFVAHNARLNQVEEQVSTVKGKAIEVLKGLLDERDKFDIIVLDPPAFIKKRKDQKAGEAAYYHINELAIRLLNKEGVLVSASCSMPLTDETLTEIVRSAARKHDRQAQLFYLGGQGPDHPVHPAIPETRYIKSQFFRLMSSS